ncbi:MAG: hypothetical protein V4638_03315 [Bacteroidota bacterium]
MFIKITIVALAIFSSGVINAQNSVKWGDMTKQPGRMSTIIADQSGDFYALRYTGGMFGSLTLSSHKDLALSATGKIEMKVEGAKGSFQGARNINGKLFVFLSDIKDGSNTIFMQEYSKDVQPIGTPTKITSYKFEKGKFKGGFDVITSRDHQFFGVIWSIPGKKESADAYGFMIFDNEMNEVSTGAYELPYESKLSSIQQHHLSNTGDYFINVVEYKESEKKIFKSYLDYKASHIYHITPEDMEDYEINLEGKRIEAMNINSDNNGVFTLIGTYGEEKKSGVNGLFHIRLNFDKAEVISEGFQEFGKDFITQDWSDRAKEKAEKKASKGKGEPQLFSYVMRQTEILKDGSIIGSMEQYYVEVVKITDPKTGVTSTTHIYYYNDIVAFKVGTDGEFDWLNKINKLQVSTNDGGYLSSYSRFINDGKLCFIFNDNDKNYDEAGKFIAKEGGGVYSAAYTKKKNVVSIVEMDLDNGEFTRKTFFDRAELSAIAVPKFFNVDYATNTLLLYAQFGKKERFGIMNIND